MRINSLEKVERRLVGLIEKPGADQGHGWKTQALLGALKQLSYLYRGVMQLRLFLYDNAIFRPFALGCQVISVGNVTVGGTGKTPVVEVFARELQREGRKVAILSRGYKKEEPPFLRRLINRLTFYDRRCPPRIVSDGKALKLNSSMSGDEPYMLASNLPDVAVVVDKDRVKSGRYAIKELGCDTLILDDGFQYLSLKHRMEIVLIDCTNPFGNENVLPRGTLREPIKNLKRADFIFITKSDGTPQDELKARLRKLGPHAEIIECCHCARHLRDVYSREKRDLEFLQGLRVVALSGIAAPSGFEREVENRGATILDRKRFADHHRYTQQEIIDIINQSRNAGADAIITTEKDAVRFPLLERLDVPIYYLRVDIELLSGHEDFKACIARICFRNNKTRGRE
jgi:tetraacyldisaccharide 4'-kinase